MNALAESSWHVLACSVRGHASEASAERAMERAFRAHRADYGDHWQDERTGRWHWHVCDEVK